MPNEGSRKPRVPYSVLADSIRRDRSITPTDKLVMMALSSFARKGRHFTFASNDAIAREAGVATSTARASLEDLEAAGWIAREAAEEYRTGRLFRLLWLDKPDTNPHFAPAGKRREGADPRQGPAEDRQSEGCRDPAPNGRDSAVRVPDSGRQGAEIRHVSSFSEATERSSLSISFADAGTRESDDGSATTDTGQQAPAEGPPRPSQALPGPREAQDPPNPPAKAEEAPYALPGATPEVPADLIASAHAAGFGSGGALVQWLAAETRRYGAPWVQQAVNVVAQRGGVTKPRSYAGAIMAKWLANGGPPPIPAEPEPDAERYADDKYFVCPEHLRDRYGVHNQPAKWDNRGKPPAPGNIGQLLADGPLGKMIAAASNR